MKNHLTGEKNGKKIGNKLNIAVKDAEETSLSVISLSQLKKGPKY